MFEYYNESDKELLKHTEKLNLLGDIDPFALNKSEKIENYEVHKPTADNVFLHEAAIIEFKGVLFASWYNCEKNELIGRTPIRGKRSKDGGKTWSDLEIIADDPSGKILYCPPVYGIDDGKLYMLINEMVGPDLIHALDLYVLNETTDRFEMLWSRPLPFKLNTNVYKLKNGKLLLPGRIAELDGFPNTPAVLISDSGKIDADWRLVKIADNGDLPNGKKHINPELSAIINGEKVYIFSRNDENSVPLLYLSTDNGETWSSIISHDIPFSNSKIYSGTLSNGRNYVIGNIFPRRPRLALLMTEPHSMVFSTGFMLQDGPSFEGYNGKQWSYPVAHEANGKLYVIYTAESDSFGISRGAVLSVVPIDLK